MMKGIRSGAAVALLATAARAAEEAVEQLAAQVAEQAPEAAKQVITNDNAVGYLATAFNAVSHCPSVVSDTLTAVVGENPYARGAATLATLSIGAASIVWGLSHCRQKSAGAKHGGHKAKTAESSVPEATASSTAAAANVIADPGSTNESAGAEGELGEKSRRTPSPTRKKND